MSDSIGVTIFAGIGVAASLILIALLITMAFRWLDETHTMVSEIHAKLFPQLRAGKDKP
jgi:hypothetical protein